MRSMLLISYIGLLVLFGVAPLRICHALPPEAEPWDATPVYGRFETFSSLGELPQNRIRALRAFADKLWVGTDDGLARYDGAGWRSWGRKDGLPARVVSAIDVDPQSRDVWLGTWGQGLVRFSAGRFDLFDQMNSGLAGNLVFDVLVEGKFVWAATNGGVSLYDTSENTWVLYHPRQVDGTGTAITSIAADGRSVYGGAWHDSPSYFSQHLNDWISVIESTQGTGTDSIPSYSPSHLRGAITAHAQTLWWATGTRLFRRDPLGTWTSREFGGASCLGEIVFAVASPNGKSIWMSTEHGVRVQADWETDTWVEYSFRSHEAAGSVTISRAGRTLGTRGIDSTIPDNSVRCVAFQEDDVWIGTAGGLARGTGIIRWNQLPEAATGQQNRNEVYEPRESRRPTESHANPNARESNHRAIAIYGPRSRTIALPGTADQRKGRPLRADLLAVQLALEPVNARDRRHRRNPIELVTVSSGYARYGWGTAEDDFPFFASHENVLGVVGFIAPHDRITDAVVSHTEVPFMNIGLGSTLNDKDIHDNPWVFRCYGDEPRIHRALLDYLFDQAGYSRLAILRTCAPDSARHLDWWGSHARSRSQPVVADLTFDPEEESLVSTLEALNRSRPEVVLTWCDSATSAAIVREMRRSGMKQLFVGGNETTTPDFVARVGSDPGEVIALYPTRRIGEGTTDTDFPRKYAERNVRGKVPTPPDSEARRSYHATMHLIQAINASSADRVSVQRTLSAMFRSASGEMHFERSCGTTKAIIATLESGRWRFKMIP